MMVKAKITIFDDKTGMTFVEDKVIIPAYNYRSSSLAKCYRFEFGLNVFKPFAEVIEQEKIEATKDEKEETNGNS